MGLLLKARQTVVVPNLVASASFSMVRLSRLQMARNNGCVFFTFIFLYLPCDFLRPKEISFWSVEKTRDLLMTETSIFARISTLVQVHFSSYHSVARDTISRIGTSQGCPEGK